MDIIAYSGIVRLTRKDLEAVIAAQEKATINMVGLLIIGNDVSPELANKAIGIIKVHGIIHASRQVKDILRTKKP